ncbi:MAG: glycosyltransferase [Candidatus Delongbacteria bacterium]|jgi:glycosyltransferase EpsJ|nr:glycosyltransferase [Candidatus Delongbacteria bacterium]
MACEPDISVIIPAYNVGRYIASTLESLRKQTFGDFELIVINDGSSDNTLEIVNSFKNVFAARLNVIDQKNSGVSRSRNAGIEISHGKYICFIDGDDTVEPDYLQLMYERITSDDCDMVYCGYREVLTDGSVLRNYSDRYRFCEDIACGSSVLEKYLRGETYMYIWSIIFKRELIFSNNIRFRKDISYGEDQIFNFQALAKADKVSCVKKELINYLRHDSGTMQNLNNLKYLSILRSLYDLEKEFEKNKERKEILNALKYDKTVRTTIMILTNWAAIGQRKKYGSLLSRRIIRNILKRAFLSNPFRYYKNIIKSFLLLYFPEKCYNIYKNKKPVIF